MQQFFYVSLAVCAILQTFFICAFILSKLIPERHRRRRDWLEDEVEGLTQRLENMFNRFVELEVKVSALAVGDPDAAARVLSGKVDKYTAAVEAMGELIADHAKTLAIFDGRLNAGGFQVSEILKRLSDDAPEAKRIENLAEAIALAIGRINELEKNRGVIPHTRLEGLESSLNVLKNDFSDLSGRLEGLAENHFTLGSAASEYITTTNNAIKSLGDRLHTLAGQVGTDVLGRLESVEMRLADTRERLKL